MTIKRQWTQKEDDFLLYLREEQGFEKVQKWSQIAREMKLKFGQDSKNQKQCRNRYTNQLNLDQNSKTWGQQKQDVLILLHRELGNKWALIADRLNGTTQNSVKNQFYSRLRKSIRKINKCIRLLFKNRYKPFKLNLIFKLSSIVDGKLKNNIQIQSELSSSYTDLLYLIISYAQKPLSALIKQLNCERKLLQLIIAPLISLEKIMSCFSNIKTKKPIIPIFRANSQVQKLKSHIIIYEKQLTQTKALLIAKVKDQLLLILAFYQDNLSPLMIILEKQQVQQRLLDSKLIQKDSKLFIKNQKCSVSFQKIILTGMYKNKESIDKLVSFSSINDIFYQPPQCFLQSINEESQIIQVLDKQYSLSFSTMEDQWENTFQPLLHTVYDQ